MHADRPIASIQAEGTARIFDVDNVLRVFSYRPNPWTSTLEADCPKLTEHVKAAWYQHTSRALPDSDWSESQMISTTTRVGPREIRVSIESWLRQP